MVNLNVAILIELIASGSQETTTTSRQLPCSTQLFQFSMPPDRGRASQACTACRKQKTRCYASAGSGGACLRCERTQQPCSLDIPITPGNRDIGIRLNQEGTVDDDRLSRLENIVQNIVDRLDRIAPSQASPNASSSHGNRVEPLPRDAPTSPVDADFMGVEDTPSTIASAGPVFVLRDVAREVRTGENNAEITNSLNNDYSFDIIDSGILGSQDASSLLAIFLEHYARWVAFEETTSSEDLLAAIRKSPLLLCACCLIAVRHTTQEYAQNLAPRLFQEAKALLSTALLVIPQTIEFFQATLILSLWSTTIGQALLSIDSWLVSGFALQHALSSDLFGHVMSTAQPVSLGRQEIDQWFIWNHLCLVHLHYCVGTRRKALLSRHQIERCARILDSDRVTNFETRMVAEVNLYWIIYESCSSSTIDLPGAQARLNSWRQEWGYLFNQPRPQFVQMGFHFAQLLMYDQALKSRSAAVRESLLLEMVRLSATILNLVMDTSDLRTPHLSDHIYHIISFAAVTLCRLLHMYEDQIAVSHGIAELDQLVLTLVTWLHSIGLPCHVAHTLGDVVSAFHAKLRPNARPTPSYEEAWADADLLNFPDQFGTELFYFGNGHFSPDWDPFVRGPPT